MVGIACWKDSEGKEVEKIGKVLDQYEEEIAIHGFAYPSRDFKRNIDIGGLTKYHKFCEGFVDIDPRGGSH